MIRLYFVVGKRKCFGGTCPPSDMVSHVTRQHSSLHSHWYEYLHAWEIIAIEFNISALLSLHCFCHICVQWYSWGRWV